MTDGREERRNGRRGRTQATETDDLVAKMTMKLPRKGTKKQITIVLCNINELIKKTHCSR